MYDVNFYTESGWVPRKPEFKHSHYSLIPIGDKRKWARSNNLIVNRVRKIFF